jgi:hypothetical protein
MTESLTTSAALGIQDLERLAYFQDVFDAWKWGQRRRLTAFLTALGNASDELTDAERERFERYMRSDEGRELLADFADQAVRTRSQTATAALAVLYANPIDDPMDTDFVSAAAQALEGVSDRAIYTFLVLCRLRAQLELSAEDPVVALTDGVIARNPELVVLGHSAGGWVDLLDDLTRRGFLGVDLHGGRIGDARAAWQKYLRFSENAEGYRRVLERARRALGFASVSEPTTGLANHDF